MNVEYQEAVQEARRLVKRSEEDQWRLAQLTWEQTTQNGISQRRWAADIGIASHSYVGALARVWDRFGQRADRPSFASAIGETHTPGRAAEAEEHGSQYAAEARQAVRNMPVQDKAEVIREAMEDPDVADAVLRDPHTRRQITDSRERIVEEIEGAARDRQEASPVQRELARTGAYFDIGNHLRLARFHAAEAARQLQEIDQPDTGWMQTYERDLQEVRDALDWFDVIRRGGRVDDDALARFLEGGAS